MMSHVKTSHKNLKQMPALSKEWRKTLDSLVYSVDCIMFIRGLSCRQPWQYLDGRHVRVCVCLCTCLSSCVCVCMCPWYGVCLSLLRVHVLMQHRIALLCDYARQIQNRTPHLLVLRSPHESSLGATRDIECAPVHHWKAHHAAATTDEVASPGRRG